MNYCSNCGTAVVVRIPEGDHLARFFCPACKIVHYQNPRIVVGCVPIDEFGRILLCRRAIEPRVGYWTIPSGFMENGETLQQGAARECQEEALADVEIGSLLAVVDVLHAHQVHVMFRARLKVTKIGAGIESLEVRMVPAEEIPWQDIAFASTKFALQHFLEDRSADVELHHFTQIDQRGNISST